MTGLPEAYRGLRNPLSADTGVISQGAALYQANCAACHGSTGEGNGPAAAGMAPPPANLRWLMSRPIASDSYLMWAISEGGAGLGGHRDAGIQSYAQRERALEDHPVSADLAVTGLVYRGEPHARAP